MNLTIRPRMTPWRGPWKWYRSAMGSRSRDDRKRWIRGGDQKIGNYIVTVGTKSRDGDNNKTQTQRSVGCENRNYGMCVCKHLRTSLTATSCVISKPFAAMTGQQYNGTAWRVGGCYVNWFCPCFLKISSRFPLYESVKLFFSTL